jgi:ABC-2 type transport system permease protein
MKLISFFIKTLKENLRDWKILVLALVFAPMFVYLMYAYMNGSGTPAYTVTVLNLDSNGSYSKELIERWRAVANAEGKTILTIQLIDKAETGRRMIKNKTADLFLTIPSDFSASFTKYISDHNGRISALASYGDPSNMKFMMAASFCDYTSYGYVQEKTGIEIPLDIKFETAGTAHSQREFDLFFPALLVFSLIMVIFTAAATLIREVEKGTMARLVLSKISPFEMLGAVSINQLIIGTVCIVLTYFAGLSVGYHSDGSLWLLFMIGIITCFSVIAISLITACFIKTMFGLLTVGCFPFFILMFFSDCMFPLPKFKILSLFGNPVYMNDVLPTAIATRAFNKILNYNANFSDISFEFLLILILSILYFAIGVILFKKKHMSI